MRSQRRGRTRRSSPSSTRPSRSRRSTTRTATPRRSSSRWARSSRRRPRSTRPRRRARSSPTSRASTTARRGSRRASTRAPRRSSTTGASQRLTRYGAVGDALVRVDAAYELVDGVLAPPGFSDVRRRRRHDVNWHATKPKIVITAGADARARMGVDAGRNSAGFDGRAHVSSNVVGLASGPYAGNFAERAPTQRRRPVDFLTDP